MQFKEIEFKYNAKDISLEKFKAFCEKWTPSAYKEASGTDFFYAKPEDTAGFYRYRRGTGCHQLTYKAKTVEDNNFVRDEHNIDLASNMSLNDISALCEKHGYLYNFSLFSNCFIYTYDWYNFVYYICYDTNTLVECGRFIEIEMNEHYPWKSEKEAWNELLLVERISKSLGISSEGRITSSLFELFRKPA